MQYEPEKRPGSGWLRPRNGEPLNKVEWALIVSLVIVAIIAMVRG